MKTHTPVFIAYDRRDRSFVRLLQKLLEHEGIESRFDRERNGADADYEERIRHELAQTRSLIVVVSEHALDSAWVRAELRAFGALGGDRVVIPVALDATPPACVDPSLGVHPAIHMYEDMLAGFVELFACFSRGFLSGQRRSRDNRRRLPDRRGSMLRRLRVGLWQQFAHATGHGKFDSVDITWHASAKIIATLQNELEKYELYDQNHRRVQPRSALSQALLALDSSRPNKAVYLVEELASYLHAHFQVRSRDRRENIVRRADTAPQRTSTEVGIEL